MSPPQVGAGGRSSGSHPVLGPLTSPPCACGRRAAYADVLVMTALAAASSASLFLARLVTLAVVGVSVAVPAASALAQHVGR